MLAVTSPRNGHNDGNGKGRTMDFSMEEETDMPEVKRSEYSIIGLIRPVNIVD
jgi:hypothetical protein